MKSTLNWIFRTLAKMIGFLEMELFVNVIVASATLMPQILLIEICGSKSLVYLSSFLGFNNILARLE
jgi:hypothetical protein